MNNFTSAAIGFLYRNMMKPVLFRFDPEDVHDRFTAVGETLGRCALTRAVLRGLLAYAHPRLEQEILGIKFPNPIGLAAGFDKDAYLTDIIPAVGFGFEEVGSVTGRACAGNARPRLWRLPKSQSLAVYYGLKNEGCEKIAARLAGKKFAVPIGTSVAMTNCKENGELAAGVEDFAAAFAAFANIGSYTTVNISCPNAFGGQPFVAPDRLEALLSRLDLIPTGKPVFLKLSPDLSEKELDGVLEAVARHRVHGFICTNLTKKRENDRIIDANVPDKGGLSGRVVAGLAEAMIGRVYRRTGGRYVIIGCGGVFSAEDAFRQIRLGASLVQMITGMIFEGPQVVGQINNGLVRLLDRHGFKTIRDAVGTGA